jgi:hypothetical protein
LKEGSEGRDGFLGPGFGVGLGDVEQQAPDFVAFGLDLVGPGQVLAGEEALVVVIVQPEVGEGDDP